MQGWEWLTAARVITHKPCRLLSIVFTPKTGVSAVTIYDGDNTSAPVILSIVMNLLLTQQYDFPGGIQTDRGLYIGSFTNIEGVLVQWEVD